MGRRTDTRAIQGHRKQVRPISGFEEGRLLQMDHARRAALEQFDAYVYDLYKSGVSQTSIGAVLGLTQQAVARRLHYREERLARNDGDPGYERPRSA